MRKSIIAVFAVLILCGATACRGPYRDNYKNEIKSDNWTEDQQLASLKYSYRRPPFSKELPDHSGFVPAENALHVQQVRERLESFLRDYDFVLSYKDEELNNYVDLFNMREAMKFREKVLKFIYSRIQTRELQVKFMGYMRLTSNGDEHELYGYNSRKIFMPGDPTKQFPFTSDQIEEAKKSGVLQQTQTGSADVYNKYDSKVPDPAHPDSFPNEFKWKPDKRSVVLYGYKIENTAKPQDGSANYLEGFVVIDGKPESLPRLRVFFPTGDPAVVVIDSDREGKDPGFGLPNFVERMPEVRDVKDVVANIMRNDLIAQNLFKEKTEERRIPPEHPKLFVEVARYGEEFNEWDKCPEPEKVGCIVPFKYWNEPKKSNYRIKIKLKKREHTDDPGMVHDDYREIDAFIKEWSGSYGIVHEYFRPKPDFMKKMNIEVTFSEEKKVHFTFESGDVVEGVVTPSVNKFIEDAPYAVIYPEGERWWWIEKNPNSKYFDKRKETSRPQETSDVFDEDGGMNNSNNSYNSESMKAPQKPAGAVRE